MDGIIWNRHIMPIPSYYPDKVYKPQGVNSTRKGIDREKIFSGLQISLVS